MTPVFFKHDQIDKKRWDRCVEQHGRGNFYSLSWYLDSICKEWHALIVGDYEYIMPLPTKSKGFLKIAYQPFFSRNFDVIGPATTADIKHLFLRSIPKKYVQVMIGLSADGLQQIPGFYLEKYPYQALELSSSVEALGESYSENARRILNKLNKTGFVYRAIETEEVIKLFIAETAEKIENLTHAHINHLRSLFTAAIKNQAGFALGAFNMNNELEAAGFFIQYQDVVCYLKGASSAEGRKNGAMYGIMQEVIQRFADSDKHLDFGGSRIDSIAQFFKKFGATDRYYTFLKKDQSFLIHLSRQLYHKLKR